MAASGGRRSLIPEFGPLAGIRVIDSGRFVAGPWAATLLAEFGAEVIKVEGPPFSPPFADPTRTLVPSLPPDAPQDASVSESWVQYARNKLSLGLDIRSSEGREVFLELLAKADIWVESSRPGTYDAFGLADATAWQRNPRLTIVHVSGFGRTGDARRITSPSYDLTGQAFSGFLGLQGNPDPAPPMRLGVALNDTVTGLASAAAALMGHISAQRTGRGQAVDVAQYEVFLVLLENLALDYFMRGVVRTRQGTAHPRLHPYDVYACADGWVVVAAPTDAAWKKLAVLLNLQRPDWGDGEARRRDRADIDDIISKFCRSHSGSALEDLGRQNDVSIARVSSIADLARDPHVRSRNMFAEWTDPVAGPVKGAGIAPRFESTPGRVWRGAPWLGQDNRRILSELLSFDSKRVDSMVQAGVIGEYRPNAREWTPFFVREGL